MQGRRLLGGRKGEQPLNEFGVLWGDLMFWIQSQVVVMQHYHLLNVRNGKFHAVYTVPRLKKNRMTYFCKDFLSFLVKFVEVWQDDSNPKEHEKYRAKQQQLPFECLGGEACVSGWRSQGEDPPLTYSSHTGLLQGSGAGPLFLLRGGLVVTPLHKVMECCGILSFLKQAQRETNRYKFELQRSQDNFSLCNKKEINFYDQRCYNEFG